MSVPHASVAAPRVGPGWIREHASGWRLVAWLLLMPILVALAVGIWDTPYGISETIAILADLDDRADAVANLWDYRQPLFRPLFWGLLLFIWQQAPDVPRALDWYRALHVVTAVAIPVSLLVVLRPRSALEAAVALLATATLVGSPAFRENLENLPLNQMLLLMWVAVVVWGLAETRRWWSGPLAVTLVVVALGLKEEGLAIAAVVVAAGLTRAPGIRPAVGLLVAGIAAVYALMRLSQAGSWPLFMQGVGYGFTMLTPSEAADRFGAWPLLIYAYNVVCTAANVLFSEPTGGVFTITRALMDGTFQVWQVNHLLSSVMVTAVVGWWGWRTWRDPDATADRRLLAMMVVALAASSVLGFKYTRDRFGGVATVFYAAAVYRAGLAAVHQVLAAHVRPVWLLVVLCLVVQSTWQLRALGTLHYVHTMAAKNRLEWIVGLGDRRARWHDRPTSLRLLDAMERQGSDPRTTLEPYATGTLDKVFGQ